MLRPKIRLYGKGFSGSCKLEMCSRAFAAQADNQSVIALFVFSRSMAVCLNRIIPSYINETGIIIPDLNHNIESILLNPKKPVIQSFAFIKAKTQLIKNMTSGTE